MLQRRLFYLVVSLLLLAEGSACAQYVGITRLKALKYQFMAFGVISFYSNDSRITTNSKASKGYGASFKVEIPLTKGIRFVPGLEIMHQGLDFDSYYFAPGYSVTFDKSFDYHHTIRTTELSLPLLIKVALTKKRIDDLPNFMYATAGWEIKYNLNSHTTITQNSDGSFLYDGNIQLPYESEFLGSGVGNYIVAGLGLNHNFLPKKNSLVFELTYRYGLARTWYRGNPYADFQFSNNILYRNANLSVGVGLRF
jgi:hypothetical protein